MLTERLKGLSCGLVYLPSANNSVLLTNPHPVRNPISLFLMFIYLFLRKKVHTHKQGRGRERQRERERSRAYLKWGSCSPKVELVFTRSRAQAHPMRGSTQES